MIRHRARAELRSGYAAAVSGHNDVAKAVMTKSTDALPPSSLEPKPNASAVEATPKVASGSCKVLPWSVCRDDKDRGGYIARLYWPKPLWEVVPHLSTVCEADLMHPCADLLADCQGDGV